MEGGRKILDQEALSLVLVQSYSENHREQNLDLRKHKEDYKACVRAARNLASSIDPSKQKQLLAGERFYTRSRMFIERSLIHTHTRRLCFTESGRTGLVTTLAKRDDLCCVFLGVAALVVLRQRKQAIIS